jgi:uncharacterized protein YndB with AHSA1/START domain
MLKVRARRRAIATSSNGDRMFAKIALVVAVLVVALLGYAATRPDTFSVERSATIKAPPEKIYPQLADFRQWPAWSPWEKRDPAMKRTVSGAPIGKGAVYAWEGNRDVGKGRMEITESSAPTKLAIRLDFLEPFESRNTTLFTLAPRGDATDVRWTMSGPSTFMTKLMQVFVSMDEMVGKDFEAGLANLKTVAER